MVDNFNESILKDEFLLEIHLCAYNNENIIRECLKSIKYQINNQIKLAFLNDGSFDRTLDVFKEYMFDIQPEFYRIIDLHKNYGLTYGKNLLISTSKAKYIAAMDSDDVCISNRFKIQLEFLKNNPKVDVLGGLAINFEKDEQIKNLISKIKNKKYIKKFLKNKPISHNEIVKNLWRNPIIHPTVCIRRSKLINSGSYNSKYRTSQDYELWPRLYLEGLIFENLNTPLILYRKSHPKKYKPRDYFITFLIALKYYKKIIGFNYFNIIIIFLRCFLKISISFFYRLSL